MSWLKHPRVSEHARRDFLSWAAGCCWYQAISKALHTPLTIWLLLKENLIFTTNYCEMFAWKFMLQRSNADLDGRAKAPFLLLISHLYSFIFSIILSSAQSFSPIPLFFWGRKYFLSSSCSNCHLPTSLKDRKVGVWAANHWLQLPDHLGKNMCGEMNE